MKYQTSYRLHQTHNKFTNVFKSKQAKLCRLNISPSIKMEIAFMYRRKARKNIDEKLVL